MIRRRAVNMLLASATLVAAATAFGASASPAEELITAVRRTDGGAVTRLLTRGVDPNVRDTAGAPLLVIAVREDTPRSASALLASPTLDKDATNPAGENALMLAAIRGRTDWMTLLIGHGAKVDKAGWAPMHYAASAPDAAPLDVLLAAHAIVDAPSPNHTTPLMMAARYGSETTVDRLLAAGADPSAVNDLRLNAAAFAAQGQRDKLSARLAKLAAARGP